MVRRIACLVVLVVVCASDAEAEGDREIYRFPLEPSAWRGGGEFSFAHGNEEGRSFLRISLDKPENWQTLEPKRVAWPSAYHHFAEPLALPADGLRLRVVYRVSAALDTGLFFHMNTVGAHARARKPAIASVRLCEDFRRVAPPLGHWMSMDIPLAVANGVTNALCAYLNFSHQGNPAPFRMTADIAALSLVVRDEPDVKALCDEWRAFRASYEPDFSDGSDLLLPPPDHRFAEPFAVATNGRPACRIVYQATGYWNERLSSPVTRRAAEELQTMIERVTGVKVPLNPNHPKFPELRTLPAIYVGKGCFRCRGEVRAKTPDGAGFAAELRELHGTDGYAIRRTGRDLFVFGATEKGTMNGVFALLENNTDLIWARPNPDFGCVFSRVAGDFSFVWGDGVLSKPAFRKVRGIWNMHDPEYWAANFVTTCGGEWGDDELPWMRGGHNVSNFTGGFKEHPEYYGMWEGKRDKPYGNQLCYRNPEFFDVFADNVLKEMRGVQCWAVRGPTIAFDDSRNWCQCPYCTAPIDLGGGRVVRPGNPAFMSTQAFLLVNNAARRLDDVFPGKRIFSQAYYQTSEPPVCDMERNVDMMYCPYPRSDDLAPLCFPENRIWLDQLRRWRTKLDKGQLLVVRDYLGLGLRYPRPLGFSHARDFREYCKYADGIDGEGTCFRPDRAKPRSTEEFDSMATLDLSAIEYWVMFRLMWDPEQDVERLYKKYVWRTFRRAGAPMAKFFGTFRREFIHRRARSGMNDSASELWLDTVVRPGHLEKMRGWLDEAEGLVVEASSRTILARLKRRFEEEIAIALARH